MTRAAIVQMTSGTDVSANLRAARELLQEAAQQGAVLAALPENFALMGVHESDKLHIAESQTGATLGDGPMQAWLHDTARKLGLWIVAGTLPIKTAEARRVAAACLVINDQGELQARYDKMHLFDVEVADATRDYRESNSIAPGTKPVCVDTPIGKLGLTICYDLRFPELFRFLGQQGAEVFVVPSAFTVPTGRAHWEALLRARAIENLSYVLAPAQVGRHENGRETYGHSLIVDYWGTVLASRDALPGVTCVDLNLSAVREQRRRFPALEHRRL